MLNVEIVNNSKIEFTFPIIFSSKNNFNKYWIAFLNEDKVHCNCFCISEAIPNIFYTKCSLKDFHENIENGTYYIPKSKIIIED